MRHYSLLPLSYLRHLPDPSHASSLQIAHQNWSISVLGRTTPYLQFRPVACVHFNAA
jgi:hypothetical protein